MISKALLAQRIIAWLLCVGTCSCGAVVSPSPHEWATLMQAASGARSTANQDPAKPKGEKQNPAKNAEASPPDASPPQDPASESATAPAGQPEQEPEEEPKQEPAQEPEEEESEVLEERRRGAEEEVPGDEQAFYWFFGPRFELLDGDLILVLGGRVHYDVAGFIRDQDIKNGFDSPDPGGNTRRAFVELGGVYKRLEFNFWLNFSSAIESLRDDDDDADDDFTDNIDYRNVFVGLLDVPVVGGIRAGFFKEPFGLEEITSSNDITFMERSLTDAFIERRNLGVMFHRRITGARRMTVSVGGFRDTNTDLETQDGYGITSRITGTPILSEDGRQVLHLGLAGTYRWTDDDNLRFAQRPESAQAQILADTGPFRAHTDMRFGVEAAVVLGSLSLQTEYMVAAARGTDGFRNSVFHSVYGMVSYVLTGEHRAYRPRVGAFGTVHPVRAFPFVAGGAGAWELTGRYSYLDLDSGDVRGGALHDWTTGVNWYLNDNARVMFNYIIAHPEGFDYEHIFQTRFQLSF